MGKKKLVIINGSPRPDEVSNTKKALDAFSKDFIDKNKARDIEVESVYFKLTPDFRGCMNCKTCNINCNIKGDMFWRILKEMEDATDVMLGSPVYLDMPTPQTVAFLTRLNCRAESTGRKFFAGKRIWLCSTSYCSGTKTCLHLMLGACEMLGFTIPGRSTREYIQKWDDKKLRGGLSAKDDSIYL